MDGRDGLAGEGEGGVVEEGGCVSSFKRSASLDMNPAVMSESNAFGLVVVAAVVVVVDVAVDVEERLVGGCGVDNPAGNAVAVAVADDIFVVVFVLGLELLISFFFLLVVVNDD